MDLGLHEGLLGALNQLVRVGVVRLYDVAAVGCLPGLPRVLLERLMVTFNLRNIFNWLSVFEEAVIDYLVLSEQFAPALLLPVLPLALVPFVFIVVEGPCTLFGAILIET